MVAAANGRCCGLTLTGLPMNLQKIVKILPMLDSPVDAEALTALRVLQRALLPETCGDIARLIEANGFGPEPEPVVKRPFNGFTAAKAKVKPPRPGWDWIWDEAAWAWKQRVKPPKPAGDGWAWKESLWEWRQVHKPISTRFETVVWNTHTEEWTTVQTDFAKVRNAAMEVMNQKLSRNARKEMEQIFVDAMSEKPISTYRLQRLEQLERMLNV